LYVEMCTCKKEKGICLEGDKKESSSRLTQQIK